MIDITESAAWRNNEVIRLELCSVLDFLAAGSGKAQHWMPPGIWVAPLMILVPGLLYVPVYFLLRRFMPKPMCA